MVRLAANQVAHAQDDQGDTQANGDRVTADPEGGLKAATPGGHFFDRLDRIDDRTLIILELDPSGLIGRSVLCQLRAAPATREIPVLAYSHSSEEAAALPARDRFAAILGESLMYDDFLAALGQAGVTP
jgi:CheY-like chemotaxis protein